MAPGDTSPAPKHPDESSRWRRARRPEQKEERVRAILDAAAELFQQHPVSDITIGAIAVQAGLAKGSIYRYFTTKEEVLVTLLVRELELWFAEIHPALASRAGAGTPESVWEVLMQSLLERERMIHLLARLASDLEHNLSLDFAIRLKQSLALKLMETGQLIEAVLPSLAPGDGARFLMWLQVLISGLWPMAHPVGTVCEAMSHPMMDPFRVQFQPEVQRMALSLLRGMMHPR